MSSVRRNTAWGIAGTLSAGLVLSGLIGQPASSATYPPTTPPTTTPPTTAPPTTAPPTTAAPTTSAPTTPPPTTPTPEPKRLPLRLRETNRKTYVFNQFVTLINFSNTRTEGVVKRSVVGRPVRPSAAGEVRFIRTQITRRGGVRVKVQGYGKVRVFVRMRAVPKPRFVGEWLPSKRYRNAWILRDSGARSASNVSAAGAAVSLRIGVAA